MRVELCARIWRNFIQDKYFAGVVLNEFYVNVCIPQLKLINFIFLFVMKEAFLPLILNCENIFKTFNIMKVLMVFFSTPLQVVWDYCAGILIF